MVDEAQDGTKRLDPGQSGTPCRALALLPGCEPFKPHAYAERPDAALLAHLIGTREHVGQSRRLRRASPETASAAYRAATDMPHAPPGVAASRIL